MNVCICVNANYKFPNNMWQKQINGNGKWKMGRAEIAKWQIQFNIFGSFWTFDLGVEIKLRNSYICCCYPNRPFEFQSGINLQSLFFSLIRVLFECLYLDVFSVNLNHHWWIQFKSWGFQGKWLIAQLV